MGGCRAAGCHWLSSEWVSPMRPTLAFSDPGPTPPPPFSHQSICGDCVQRQTAHPAALLESGEKGDQGIPGVPGLDSCARVGGWAWGGLGAGRAPG